MNASSDSSATSFPTSTEDSFSTSSFPRSTALARSRRSTLSRTVFIADTRASAASDSTENPSDTLSVTVMEPESNPLSLELEGETTVAAGSNLAGESVNQETVLFAIRELRATIRKELLAVKTDMVKMLEMQSSLMGKMVALDSAVQGLGDSGLIQTAPSGPSPKLRYLSEPKLEHLLSTFSDSNAAVPIIQLACIITTTSLSKRIPHLHGLVSAGIFNYLGSFQDVVGQSSGFATLMFAVRGNAAKSKFKFANGCLWLFRLKR